MSEERTIKSRSNEHDERDLPTTEPTKKKSRKKTSENN